MRLVPGGRPQLALVAALIAVVGGLVPAPASAFSINPPGLIRYSYCWQDLAWRGDAHWSGYQWKGTVDHCFFLIQVGTIDSAGRVQDGDSSADYYVVNQGVEWTTTQGQEWAGSDNYAKLTAKSTIAAISGVAKAAPATTTFSNSSCNVRVNLSYGWAGFSVGVSLGLCPGYTLSRDSETTTSGQWSAAHAPKTPYWDTAYMIKVGQGVKPTFNGVLTRPFHKVVESGYVCGSGGCATTYSLQKSWRTTGFSITAP